MHRHPSDARRGAGLMAGLIALGAGLLVATAASRTSRPHMHPGDAPEHAVRRSSGRGLGRRESDVVGRSVTIRKPKAELFAVWRDFARFPEFMEHVEAVTPKPDGTSHWKIAGPAGSTVEFDAEIVEERENKLIFWRSVEGADIRNSGRVTFRDAPADRGTVVDLEIAYDSPGGMLGRQLARIMQREPNTQARRDLKRFKQLMETGEIATAAPGPAAPRS